MRTYTLDEVREIKGFSRDHYNIPYGQNDEGIRKASSDKRQLEKYPEVFEDEIDALGKELTKLKSLIEY